MGKKLLKLVIILCCFCAVTGTTYAFATVAQQDTTKKKAADAEADNDDSDNGDDAKSVSAVLSTASKNATFDDVAKYTFEVKNPTDNVQEGKVSYDVFTETGVKLSSASVNVNIGKKSSGKYNFEIPEPKPGFYKLNFMVNVTDPDSATYDDTTRRVFGIKPEQIRSPYPKPADFDQFWQKAKDELARVPPQFKCVLLPKLSQPNRKVYAIEMQSLDNYTIRGWLTVPVTKDKNKKFAVLLGLPGYQVDLAPIMGMDADLAIITLNVRGQGTSRGPIDTRKDEYIFFRVENKDRYVMRGAIMDCLRAVDFIFSQPELDHSKIIASGGSMGGFLAIATASLDKRVALCSAQNPILCDIRNLPNEVEWPMTSFYKYIETRPGLTLEKVMNNLDYYDTKNFATNLQCSTIMGIGLLDPYAPPNNEYAAYNAMPAKKRLLVFKDLGHEVSQVYKNLEGRWMRDSFGLF